MGKPAQQSAVRSKADIETRRDPHALSERSVVRGSGKATRCSVVHISQRVPSQVRRPGLRKLQASARAHLCQRGLVAAAATVQPVSCLHHLVRMEPGRRRLSRTPATASRHQQQLAQAFHKARANELRHLLGCTWGTSRQRRCQRGVLVCGCACVVYMWQRGGWDGAMRWGGGWGRGPSSTARSTIHAEQQQLGGLDYVSAEPEHAAGLSQPACC